ncbi:MAG: DUF1638 domain-containing protein [Candidatus Methanospirareceae archaeon]
MHIGIITCEILRSEIRDLVREIGVHEVFFALPEKVNPVTVVPYSLVIDRFSRAFRTDRFVVKVNALEKIAKEIRERALTNSVIISVMELRFHTHSDVLLMVIEEGIQRLSSVAEVIVLGYGLCGCSPIAMERAISEAPLPVLIPRDSSGEILNNCIEIALGKQTVQSLRDEEAGTFFMTPVGAALAGEPQVILESSGSPTAGRTSRHDTAEDTKRVLQLMKDHYSRVVKVWDIRVDLQDREYALTVKRFARKFNLDIILVKGSSKLMLDTIEKAGIIPRE